MTLLITVLGILNQNPTQDTAIDRVGISCDTMAIFPSTWYGAKKT